MKYLITLSFLLLLFSCNEESSMENTNTENSIDKTESVVAEKEIPTKAEEITAKAKEEIKEKVKETEEIVKKQEEKALEIKKEVKKVIEQPKKKKKRSKISFSETKWNFGDIKDGDIVKHDFKFKNTGNAPLMIKNVTASCGCTQPSFPFLPIAPGEEGIIGVTFNSTGKINEQRPTVTVITNGRPSTLKLHLEGIVRPK